MIKLLCLYFFYISHLLHQLSLTHTYKMKLALMLLNFLMRRREIQRVLNTTIIFPLGFASI